MRVERIASWYILVYQVQRQFTSGEAPAVICGADPVLLLLAQFRVHQGEVTVVMQIPKVTAQVVTVRTRLEPVPVPVDPQNAFVDRSRQSQEALQIVALASIPVVTKRGFPWIRMKKTCY